MASAQLLAMIESAQPILDSLYEGLVIIDEQGIIRYVNNANTRITGMERKTLVGRYVTDAVPYSRLLHTLHTGETQRGVQTRVGEHVVVSSIVPLLDKEKLIGAMSIFRDITEVLRLTEQLQVATETIRTMQAQATGHEAVLMGAHPKSVLAWQLANRAALIPSTVLLTGESGTGKEVMARFIHSQSEQREKPFLAVNCAAISESLLESELFGYEEGAFTGARKGGRPGYFEMAEGGTLFLDEISEMSVHLQAKLLRVLQDTRIRRVGGTEERQVQVRLIAATNRNLIELVEDGRFRRDLYYRLAVFPIHLPPLREIASDINRFAHFFLGLAQRKLGRTKAVLSRQSIAALEGYAFPGNLRELGNLMERAVALCDGDVIEPDDLPLLAEQTESGERLELDLATITLADAERLILKRLLATCSSKTEVANRLGIARATLYRKLKEYQLI